MKLGLGKIQEDIEMGIGFLKLEFLINFCVVFFNQFTVF